MIQCIFWKSKWEPFDNFSMVQLLTADHSGGHYDRTYVHQSLSPRHHHILTKFFYLNYLSYLVSSLFLLYFFSSSLVTLVSPPPHTWPTCFQIVNIVFVMEWKVVTQLLFCSTVCLSLQVIWKKKTFSIQDYIALYNRIGPKTLLTSFEKLDFLQ